jgi:hypothetical protein
MTLASSKNCEHCGGSMPRARRNKKYHRRCKKAAENARRSFVRRAKPKAGSSPTPAVAAAMQRYVREIRAVDPDAPEEQLRLQAVAYVLGNPDRDVVADLKHIGGLSDFCSTPCEPCSRFWKMIHEFGAFSGERIARTI